MKKMCFVVLLLVVLQLLCVGCKTEMTAYIINNATGAQEETTLAIENFQLHAPDSLDANFILGDNCRWSFAGRNTSPYSVLHPLSSSYEELKDFIIAYTLLYDSVTNAGTSAWFALDQNAGLMIIALTDCDHVIVASTEKSIAPNDIIDHFQAAIDRMSA